MRNKPLNFRKVEGELIRAVRQELKKELQLKIRRKEIIMEVINNLTRYNKLWVALIGALVNILVAYFGGADWLNTTVALLTALGVYTVANK